MAKLKCPKCHVGGFTQSVAYDGRPKFECARCGNWWTVGKSGGEYAVQIAEEAKNSERRREAKRVT